MHSRAKAGEKREGKRIEGVGEKRSLGV